MKGNRLYVIADELRVKPASNRHINKHFSGLEWLHIQADTAVHQPTQAKRHCMSFGGHVLAGDALEMVHSHGNRLSYSLPKTQSTGLIYAETFILWPSWPL
jgi:hypothetical protein